MKEPEKKDSGEKKPSSFPIPSANDTGRDDKTAFDIPSADSAPNVKKRSLSILKASEANLIEKETTADTPATKSSEEDDTATKFDINASDIPELNKSGSSLDDTSFDISSADIAELEGKKRTKKSKSMEETDGEVDEEELKMALSTEEDENSLKYSYHEDESDSEKSSASIFDLLDKNEIDEETLSGTDTDLSETLSGKSLDEVLKTSQKKDEDWHESKNESISDRKKQQTSHKKLKIILAVAILIIVVVAIIMNIVMGKLNTPEQDQTIESVSFDKIKIPSNLKNEKKLNAYLNMGLNLYNNKKYKKAESILKKLLRTGWNSGLINGLLGNCKLQQNDEKGAESFYRKCIESGYNDKIEFAMNLAKILDKQKNYAEVISSLEPLKEKYAADQEMQLLLSVAYYNSGELDKALECYKLLNPSILPEKQLKEYAQLLEKKGNKHEAFKIFLTLGKVYNNTSAYIKAEELAPDETTKMSILAQIVSKTGNTPRGIYFKMRLGIKMFNSGQQSEGLQILKGVNAEKLNKRDATEYLEMLPHFEGDKFLTQEALEILTKYYSNDVKMHEKLKEILLKDGKVQFCADFFKNEYFLYQKNPVTSYMYANFQSDPKVKIQLYQNAIRLSPDFFEGNLALGKFYINEQKWKEAAQTLSRCEKLKPASEEAKYYSTIAKIKLTGKGSVLKYYENFLNRIEKPKDEILKQMVLLSQYMRDEKYALIYLKQAERLDSLKEFSKRESIKLKLIYGGAQKSDFKNLKDPIIKKYYMIYLLGKGDYSEMMRIPTKKEDFPDFWKVLVGWKQEIPSWENNAHLLLKRNKDNLLVTTVAKMWLREVKPETATALLDRIDYIDKPLLCILIAEQYRKNMDSLKSRFLFRRALTYSNPNIYVEAANYLRKNK